LLEVHSLEEMDRALSISTPPDMLGINNRDLSDFSVSLSNTSELLKDGRMERIRENGSMVVAESGIATNEDVLVLQQAGVDAILVGERLTRHSRSASGEIAELYGDCMQESESIAATTGRDAG
jgi:indole-3-glycerol phosphate synthase